MIQRLKPFVVQYQSVKIYNNDLSHSASSQNVNRNVTRPATLYEEWIHDAYDLNTES